jgi:hypothetical protein
MMPEPLGAVAGLAGFFVIGGVEALRVVKDPLGFAWGTPGPRRRWWTGRLSRAPRLHPATRHARPGRAESLHRRGPGAPRPRSPEVQKGEALRIALTYNLKLSDSEDEAEFDTQETVNALASAIERLGHRLERFEVSGPPSRTVARLEAYSPDLIFNTAEGRRGRFREAFYPALFEELGFAFTGSDAYALALTLDKQLTKLVLSKHGIRTPAGSSSRSSTS